MYICNSFYKFYMVRYTTQKSEKFDSQYNSHFDNHTDISVFAKEKMTSKHYNGKGHLLLQCNNMRNPLLLFEIIIESKQSLRPQ